MYKFRIEIMELTFFNFVQRICSQLIILSLVSGMAIFTIPKISIAQDVQASCLGVINFGRSESRRYVTKRDFESHQSNFCREYRRASSTGKSASYGGSYKLLSLSAGQSRFNASEVASRYCGEEGSTRDLDEAYQYYKSEIPSDAFQAYEACIKSVNTGGITVDSTNAIVTHNEFFIGVRFDARSEDEEATVETISTEGVNCEWQHIATSDTETIDGTTITMRDSTQANLNCSRENWNNSSAISIYRANGEARMKMHWDSFVEEEGRFISNSVLQEINERLENISNQIIRIDSGSISISQEETKNLWQLQPDSPSIRGTVGGEIKFKEAFQNPPIVVVAFSHIDIASGANVRLSTFVTSVTNDGFTYDFRTWKDTRVWRGTAQWIAYGY